jgi:AcrR family transcriptional regulator
VDPGQLAVALWNPADAGRRGPKPRVSVEDIVAAAIAVADTEGLAAASMQRIGERLEVTKMALYRHIGGRAELLALMLDTAMGPPPVIDHSAATWRNALCTWARAAHQMFSDHPWVMQIAVGARVLGPNELAWTEQGLTILADTRLSPAERLDTLALLSGHARSIVQQGVGHDGHRITDPEGRIRTAMASVLADRMADFPAVAHALTSSTPGDGVDDALNFGLDRILDGVEAHNKSRRRR